MANQMLICEIGCTVGTREHAPGAEVACKTPKEAEHLLASGFFRRKGPQDEPAEEGDETGEPAGSTSQGGRSSGGPPAGE